MKVIMLQNVKGVGQKDTLVEVADGYALNALIPAGKAAQATKGEVEALQKRKKLESEQAETDRARNEALIAKIDGIRIVIKARANPKGSLFKAIAKQDVAAALAQASSSRFNPDLVEEFSHPIKELGEHTVRVASGGAKASVQLVVEAL